MNPHSTDLTESFVVVHDRSATYDYPGAPQIMGIHVRRDLAQGTYQLDFEQHPTVPLAQHWLTARDCPPDAVLLPPNTYPEPADEQTIEIEERLRNSGTRYEVLQHYTNDCFGYETWTIVRDNDPRSHTEPFRLFLEEGNEAAFTYTVREGAFTSEKAAEEWTQTRDSPLPTPAAPDPRTVAAALRGNNPVVQDATLPRNPQEPGVGVPQSIPAAPTAFRAAGSPPRR